MFKKNKSHAFIYAATAGYAEIVEKRLTESLELDVTHKNEALKAAVTNGHLPVVELLLEAGAEVSADGYAAVRVASEEGQLEILKAMVARGVAREGLDTALIAAHNVYVLRREDRIFSAIKYLIEAGAWVGAEDEFLLKDAAVKGHLPLVQFYVEQGADIHVGQDYPIRWAAHSGHLEIVTFLISKGADIHAREDFALKWAHEKGHEAVVDYIIAKGNWRSVDKRGKTRFAHLGNDCDDETGRILIQKIEAFQKAEEARVRAEEERKRAEAILEAERKERLRLDEIAQHRHVAEVMRAKAVRFKVKKVMP